MYYKKPAALPAAALPLAAADRNRNRTARTFFAKKFACRRSERLGGIAAASRSAFFIVYYLSFLCIHFSCVNLAQAALIIGCFFSAKRCILRETGESYEIFNYIRSAREYFRT